MADSGTELPVTLLIPTLNEEDHIGACLASVVAQTYPLEAMEVLVIDGGSTDRTRAIVTEWTDRIPGLKLVDNPRRIQAVALNLGMKMADNDLMVRLDAHTTYADNFVEASVHALRSSGATMVGGPMRPRGATPFGEAVAIATTSRIGVGPGKFHFDDGAGEVDTVYLGAFDRNEVLALGGYDENFAVGEDHELNLRITRSGGRIVLDPTITSWYTPRSTPRELWKQYFRYGQAKAATLRKHRRFPSWRPLAPIALVLGLAVSAVALLTPLRTWVWIPWALYVGALLGAAGLRGPKNALSTAYAMTIMHFSYGFGLLLSAVTSSRKPS
ncbi:MAG: glycosyltransferase family 2 protein [Acidimicrobiia bacterium]|nr:glycosyltransferase family 2 protein [Acidimicrobiia bacterium]